MTEKLTHYELTAKWVNDKQGRTIMLTQPADNYEELDTVLINPWQLRAVCEQFGIIASDPQAEKTIAVLKRRLMVLRDRVDFLHNYLVNHSDHKHADLTYEVTYATATIDIADEFCAEWIDTMLDAEENPAPTKKAEPSFLQKSLL